MKKILAFGLYATLGFGAFGQIDAQSGARFDFKSVSKSSDSSEAVTTKGKLAVQGDKSRFTSSSEDNEDNQVSGDILSLDGGTRFIIILPAQKKYIESNTMNIGSTLAGIGASVKAKDVKIELKKVGAGPKILGYSTVHYKMKQSLTMVMSALGQASENKEVADVDLYFAPSLNAPSNPWNGMNMVVNVGGILGDEYAAEVKKLDKEFGSGGVILKSVSKSTSTDSDGESTTSESEFEITKVDLVNIPDSEFEIPANYTKVEMPDMKNVSEAMNKALSDLKGSAGDEAKSVKDAAKDGVKEGVNETKNEGKEAVKKETKEKAKKALKGLFGK